MPFVEGRIKSKSSILEKSHHRQLPVYDIIAYRTGYLDQSDLEQLLANITSYVLKVQVNKIYYFYSYSDDESTTHTPDVEVQLWPWIFLHFFHRNMAGLCSDKSLQHQLQCSLQRQIDQRKTT